MIVCFSPKRPNSSPTEASDKRARLCDAESMPPAGATRHVPTADGTVDTDRCELHVSFRNDSVSAASPRIPPKTDFRVTHEMLAMIAANDRSREGGGGETGRPAAGVQPEGRTEGRTGGQPAGCVERTAAFLHQAGDRLTSPALALAGLDEFNRVLFEDVRVTAGDAPTDVVMTCGSDPQAACDCSALTRQQLLEQSIYEVIHR